MPIRVRIDVNGQDARTLWIGRVEGGENPGANNTYAIGHGSGSNGELEPWNYPGVKVDDLVRFRHRYGDGMERCVERGLRALRLAGRW